ncbi:MAG: ComEC/Rec2 family competence protein [Acidobacteria bacterium]|nr:MAG: ComEC/Rec2 family competence protein [Acidobacteriota bacterium]REK02659.1 MAG: ComEC/Rec2 family competence protein [Acidobacteriota bacterium]REK13537.1 MAG: ComEC/Rec2 family competence protein [Acidobacteriota bacterium]REK41531.1 MAG: ComEC/Rec2 family competence protein [Acidobacteriota bacterium]
MVSNSFQRYGTASRFSENPFALLAAAFATGIFAAGQFDAPQQILISGVVLFASIALPASRSRSNAAFILIAFAFAGAFSFGTSDSSSSTDSLKYLLSKRVISSGDPLILEGLVRSGPDLLPEGRRMDLEVDSYTYKKRNKSASGTVRVYITLQSSETVEEFSSMGLHTGARVKLAGTVTREERFNNPGGFSVLDHMDREGVDAVVTVKSPLLVERQGGGSFGLNAYLTNLRNGLVEHALGKFDQPTAGLVIASVLGSRHFLDKGSADAFRTGGTFHVLVVSGLHVTILGGAVVWILSLLRIRRRHSIIAACAAVWGFVLISGSGVPVIRAGLMFTFISLAAAFFRRTSMLNVLGASALLILVANPSALFDPSFQLTVVAVASLAGIAFPLLSKINSIGSWSPSASSPLPPTTGSILKSFAELLYWDRRVWAIKRAGMIWECGIFKSPNAEKAAGDFAQGIGRFLFEALVVSASIQLCMLPFQAVYFHRIAPAAMILNLLAGIGLIVQSLLACLTASAGTFGHAISEPFAAVTKAYSCAWLFLQSSASEFAGGDLRVPVYTGVFYSVYAAYSLFTLGVAWAIRAWNPFELGSNSPERKKQKRAVAAGLMLVSMLGGLIIFHPLSEPQSDGKLRLHFLDVGQGDSIFIEFPNGTTMLVDGGGRRGFGEDDSGRDFERDLPGIGESVVSEFLWEKGYSSIDLLVLTHGDADHANGLIDVTKNFEIGMVLIGSLEPANPDFEEFARLVRKKDVPLELVRKGDRLDIGGTSIDVLNPIEAHNGSPLSNNDRSVVLLLKNGVRRFLLTGDIESSGENALMRSLGGKIDVVKVAHHGSRTSSTERFVKKTAPEVVVIPVGRHSQFGHPHEEVVARWKAAGASVLTTGASGTVSISTDGSLLEVQTYLPLEQE